MSEQKKLRILQVHNYYQIPGGEDVVAQNERILLEKNGHTVIEYTRNNSEINELHGIKKLKLPFAAVFSVKTYREVKKIIKENKIDIVHVHNTLMMVSPSVFYAAFKCKVPVVQTLHNFRMLCPAGSFFRDNQICEACAKGSLMPAIRKKCYRNSRLQTVVSAAILVIHRLLGTYRKVFFICLTEFNRKKILLLNKNGKMIVDPEKIFVKPNFTFVDKELKNTKESMDYYLFVGRIEALKGIEIAIKAFEKLPDKKLVVAGTGPMLPDMKKYVQEHHMKNVEFVGYLDKSALQEKYCHAKAVVMTSQCYEAFAMAVAEAYSYGVPVIGGNVGNVNNMVDEGVTGIHFEYNSSKDLADKIMVYETMDIYALKKNAKEFYEKKLRPESNYVLLEEIYTKILDGSK